jgi:hypothetical protein
MNAYYERLKGRFLFVAIVSSLGCYAWSFIGDVPAALDLFIISWIVYVIAVNYLKRVLNIETKKGGKLNKYEYLRGWFLFIAYALSLWVFSCAHRAPADKYGNIFLLQIIIWTVYALSLWTLKGFFNKGGKKCI